MRGVSPSLDTNDTLALAGKTLSGKYRVDRLIGEGGTGLVYEGTNLLLGAKVAIKCTKPGEGSHDAFMKEAKLLFSFSHPNVVRLYDAGEVQSARGKLSYVVLEYLDGISLDQEIDARAREGRPFTLHDLRTIVSAVLEALGAAHNAGLVHRDMKPSNVMLCRDGVVKVLDFGTARMVDQATRFSSQFTPRYAAPEQWEPERAKAGPYTDVFGVGLLVYEMVTLQPAFDGKDLPSILKACLSNERPSIATLRPELTPLVQPILTRALALDPHARYVDASAMLAATRAGWAAGASRQLPAYGMTVPLANAPHRTTPSGTVPLGQRTLPLPPPRGATATPLPTRTPLPSQPPPQRETARMRSSAPPSAPLPMRTHAGWWLLVAFLLLLVVGLLVWLARAMLRG